MARYHDKWRQHLRRSFNRENFFLTPEGLSVFWPMYAIAPAAEGIPTFTLPFGQENCRLPGAEKTAPSHGGRSGFCSHVSGGIHFSGATPFSASRSFTNRRNRA